VVRTFPIFERGLWEKSMPKKGGGYYHIGYELFADKNGVRDGWLKERRGLEDSEIDFNLGVST